MAACWRAGRVSSRSWRSVSLTRASRRHQPSGGTRQDRERRKDAEHRGLRSTTPRFINPSSIIRSANYSPLSRATSHTTRSASRHLLRQPGARRSGLGMVPHRRHARRRHGGEQHARRAVDRGERFLSQVSCRPRWRKTSCSRKCGCHCWRARPNSASTSSIAAPAILRWPLRSSRIVCKAQDRRPARRRRWRRRRVRAVFRRPKPCSLAKCGRRCVPRRGRSRGSRDRPAERPSDQCRLPARPGARGSAASRWSFRR